MEFAIVVKKRSDDYVAYLGNTPSQWEAGATEAEAIGKLFITTHKKLGFSLLREGFQDSNVRNEVGSGDCLNQNNIKSVRLF